MADARRDRSRSPRVPRARNPDEAAEEPPKLETHLQLLEAYMKDLRKLQACQQTLLDFSEEIAEKARSMVKEHTAKIGQNSIFLTRLLGSESQDSREHAAHCSKTVGFTLLVCHFSKGFSPPVWDLDDAALLISLAQTDNWILRGSTTDST